MFKKNKKVTQNEFQNQFENEERKSSFLKRKTIKELIAPDGIDARDITNLKIISNTSKYAKSFYVSVLHFQKYLEICICLEILIHQSL